MTTVNGAVESITADREHITIRGTYSADTDQEAHLLHVYEWPAYEQVTNAVERSPSQTFARSGKDTVEFHLTIQRFAQERDRVYSRFKVGAATQDGAPVSAFAGRCYVDRLCGFSMHDFKYPSASTIKGLQVRMVDDAIRLGVGHAALNLNLPTIIRPARTDTTITYRMDGREYYFDGEYMSRFDQRVKELSDHGIVINLILLNSTKWDGIEIDPGMRQDLLHPDYDPEGFISAFNTVTRDGLAYYQAFIEFVAERYTRPDQKHGRACGYIIGNEVDSQWVWCNAGEKTVQEYTREYAIALRTAFYAVRKKYSQARVYVSLDHLWTISHLENPLRTYKGRDIIDLLNDSCLKEGNFDWSVAYHPYPQNLFHADFWNDETALASFDTPRITFKNLGILTQYMSQPHLLYNGRPRHIILSEQGFHSDETEESEQLQAAAYAYAYWKVQHTPGIESFILHAHVDNRDEFGLNLGL